MSDETFDFEAFISGTQLAQIKTGFYRLDHRVKIAELTKEHDALAPAADDREGSKSNPRKKLAEQIAALRDEMEASRVELTIRALTPDEFRKTSDDDTLDVYDQLVMQSVEPKLNREQWKTLADRIGFAQFAQISKDASDLILSRVAVPDFSRSVSATLNPVMSSES